LISPRSIALEHLYGFVALALRHAARVPEATGARDIVRRKIHMRRKLIGEPADLSTAHRVGLAG